MISRTNLMRLLHERSIIHEAAAINKLEAEGKLIEASVESITVEAESNSSHRATRPRD